LAGAGRFFGDAPEGGGVRWTERGKGKRGGPRRGGGKETPWPVKIYVSFRGDARVAGGNPARGNPGNFRRKNSFSVPRGAKGFSGRHRGPRNFFSRKMGGPWPVGFMLGGSFIGLEKKKKKLGAFIRAKGGGGYGGAWAAPLGFPARARVGRLKFFRMFRFFHSGAGGKSRFCFFGIFVASGKGHPRARKSFFREFFPGKEVFNPFKKNRVWGGGKKKWDVVCVLFGAAGTFLVFALKTGFGTSLNPRGGARISKHFFVGVFQGSGRVFHRTPFWGQPFQFGPFNPRSLWLFRGGGRLGLAWGMFFPFGR